jgi:SAM-dependent methyltransferase
MTKTLSNPEQYSKLWTSESDFLDSHNIYEKLAKLTPLGNVLELGCGIGAGTQHLSSGRNLLSLDSNSNLIKAARERLVNAGINHNIHECDFFHLGDEDKRIINKFNPKVIAAWFIGSHGMDIYKHTKEEPNEHMKSKLYREKIEDVIISSDMRTDTVDFIHLVNRGGIVAGFTEVDFFNETKKDYDTYVFKEVGFEVVSVNLMDWPREGSDFGYIQAPNPILAQGEATPSIISIIAKRINGNN